MNIAKEIFNGKLRGKIILRSPWAKYKRTAFVIELWKNDLLKFDSIYRGESGMSFEVTHDLVLVRPFRKICEWLDIEVEPFYPKGEKILFRGLDLIKVLEYKQLRESRI